MKKMLNSPEYASKLAKYQKETLYLYLDKDSKSFIDKLCEQYAFTFQEFRQLAEIARDLEMWQEGSLASLWQKLEDPGLVLDNKDQKEYLLKELKDRISNLKKQAKSYPQEQTPESDKKNLTICCEESNKPIFGYCPVASPKTVCCNLRTLDAVENCAYDCSYCTIQTFYGDAVTFHADLKEKLAKIDIEKERFYHIGTGQSSDALVWGNQYGLLDELCSFAAKHRSCLLEFKTKSANISYFLEHETPPNIVCSWTLNTDTIINNEEHNTASLTDRLAAARELADHGVKVAFHFHPIVYYDSWKKDYKQLAEQVLESFDTQAVLFISFGSVTFIKPVIKQIRQRGLKSRILQMEMEPDPHGKLSYPAEIKLKLFDLMNQAFSPWHDKVYRYFCMEDAYYWDQVFGWHYDSNEEFERDFGVQVMKKINNQ